MRAWYGQAAPRADRGPADRLRGRVRRPRRRRREDAARPGRRRRAARRAGAAVRRAAVQEPRAGRPGARAVRTLDLFLTALGPAAARVRRHPAEGERGRAGRRRWSSCVDGWSTRTACRPGGCASSCRSRRRRRCSAPTAGDRRPDDPGRATGGCTGLHYGTYDYSAALRHRRRVPEPGAPGRRPRQGGHAGGRGRHRGTAVRRLDQRPAGRRHRGRARRLALHARLVRRSLERGFYQGWDLHPAQLPTRYAATYAFFRDGLRGRGRRGCGATWTGRSAGILDEPATARALAGFLLRGLDCGALRRRPRCGFDRAVLEGAVSGVRPGAALAAGGACPDGERPAAVARPRRADRRVARVRRAAAAQRPRRPGAAARPGRHPRARQRARPHRVGGLRHRHPGRRGRRRHHDRRHAAQLAAADRRPSPRCAAKRPAAAGQCYVDVGFWGGAVPGNAGELPALHDAGVFGFKCFLVDSGRAGVPAAGPGRAGRGAGRGRRAVHRARRGPGAAAAAPASSRRTPTSSPPGRRRPRPARSPRRSTRPRRTGARVHILHLSAADALPLLARGRARDGVRVTAETCPHYLTLDGRGRPRRRHPVQVLPADPRTRPTGTRCGPGLADGTIDCVVSDHSPVPARAQAAATPATSPPPGAGSPRCSSGCRWCGPRRAAAASRLADVVRWMAQRPGRPGRAAPQGPHRGRAPTPTWSRSPRTRRSPSTRPRCTTATRSRRTPGTRRCAGVVHADLAARA